ncbi:MAG: zinc ribbon domain-containing protein [Chloroflexi bacterium]|nr:zinc ribbon domain-containing protein [Chloroflexota bacterium]
MTTLGSSSPRNVASAAPMAAAVMAAPKVQARCPSCNQPVRAGAKFCDNREASLVLVCAKCGTQLPPGSKFCDSCGAPAQSGA